MVIDNTYILEYYVDGLFSDEDMELFILAGMITQEQYDSVKKPV